MKKKVSIFISYSWEDESHNEWVYRLADIITAHGGDVIIDKNLSCGGHLRLFMERNILTADVVLLILTPKYKQKAEHPQGGVGFEYNIITSELIKIIDCNEKYVPVLRSGNHESSVPTFMKMFKYTDLRAGLKYEENLDNLMQQILKSPNITTHKKNSAKQSFLKSEYKPLNALKADMLNSAEQYFNELFVKKSPFLETQDRICSNLHMWEFNTRKHSEALIKEFNPVKMRVFENYKEDFKNNIFGSMLRSVASVRFLVDPEFAAYKSNFRRSDEDEVYTTVNDILNATHMYVERIAPEINYETVKTVEDLQVGFLNLDKMVMNKIIGFGIRSELLHRYYPAHFPVMTQKNLWALYFLCETATEFIALKQFNHQMRISHNWQYPYDRYCYLMTCLYQTFCGWISRYDVNVDHSLRYGYTNHFLNAIYDHHRKEIDTIRTWTNTKQHGQLID